MEWWDENNDEDISEDVQNDEPDTPIQEMTSQEDLTRDERSVIWWVVVFTCLLQTMHSLPSRAIVWLLHFLGSLFTFLSQYSSKYSPCLSFNITPTYKLHIEESFTSICPPLCCLPGLFVTAQLQCLSRKKRIIDSSEGLS